MVANELEAYLEVSLLQFVKFVAEKSQANSGRGICSH